MEYNSISHQLSIEACAPLPHDTKPQDVAAAYLSLCDSNSSALRTYFSSDPDIPLDLASPQPCPCVPAYTFLDARPLLTIFAGKKYKPVALKVRPVETELPSRFRIVRNIKGDPLQDLPSLPTLYLTSRRGATQKSAKTLSTGHTQVTSFYPPNVRSCTVS